MTEKTFHDIAGQGKYVFIDIYGKGCVWCYRILPELNKLFDHFMTHRKDIVFAKIDGNDNMELLRRFKVQMYPSLILLRPFDTRFGIKYDGERSFEEMKQFLDSFDPLDKKIEEELTPAATENLCKPFVDKAIQVFERDIRSSGLLLSKDDLKYYTSVTEGVKELAKNDKNAQMLVEKLKPLEIQAKNADKQDLKEFEEFRKDVIKETKNQFIQISEKIASKIADIEAILDTRILQRRNSNGKEENHETENHVTKNSGTPKDQNLHTKRKDPQQTITASEPTTSVHQEDSKSDDGFAYSYLIKYALCIVGGMAGMLLYQRFSSLEHIIKQAHE